MEKKTVLAVDIGGTKYAVALVRENGTILCKKQHNWRHISTDSVVAEICGAMEELIRETTLPVSAIGITITGLTDPITGSWISATYMGIYGFPIGKVIQERFGLPVYVENDCNASAVAEKMFGLCKKTDHFIYLSVSNGIGGALYLGGKLYRGAYGIAGEIGNCRIEEGIRKGRGPVRRDTLENLASGRGLVDSYIKLGGRKKIDGEAPNGLLISRLAKSGDQAALDAFNLEGRYLGQVLGSCCMVLNPERIILGGGVAMSFDLFKQSLFATMEQETRLFASSEPPKIQVTGFGYDGALLGAAAVALCEQNC